MSKHCLQKGDRRGHTTADIQSLFLAAVYRTRSVSRNSMAPASTPGEGVAPTASQPQVGHSLPCSQTPVRAESSPATSLSGFPELLWDEPPASPGSLSDHAVCSERGTAMTPATCSILSPAQMSVLLLSLPTRQDMENIVTRLDSSLRQDMTEVKQSIHCPQKGTQFCTDT